MVVLVVAHRVLVVHIVRVVGGIEIRRPVYYLRHLELLQVGVSLIQRWVDRLRRSSYLIWMGCLLGFHRHDGVGMRRSIGISRKLCRQCIGSGGIPVIFAFPGHRHLCRLSIFQLCFQALWKPQFFLFRSLHNSAGIYGGAALKALDGLAPVHCRQRRHNQSRQDENSQQNSPCHFPTFPLYISHVCSLLFLNAYSKRRKTASAFPSISSPDMAP